jgi:thiol-disulfide isomerase/thioredoxin
VAIRPAAYLLAVSLLAGVCFGQRSLPGCEPRPEVRQVLKQKLNFTVSQSLNYADLVALQHEVFEDLVARYPRESEPYTRLIQFVRWDDPDRFPALQTRLRQQAATHPEDPLALHVAGVALFETDTPESIRLLEAAKAKAPDFVWPNFELAQIYSAGKRADKKKAAEYVAAFFSACPDSDDRVAHRLLGKFGDPALQARVAAALRSRLDKETDLDHLGRYEVLWGLEFRIHPPQEHPALRRQVAADLKRLEKLDPQSNVLWMESLKRAYKQSGASDEAIAAFDDRILKEFPNSQFTPDILYKRWDKAHKKPEDPLDPAWRAYNQAYKDAVKGWIRDYPGAPYFSRGDAWFSAIREDDSIPEKEGVEALDRYLQARILYDSPAAWYYLNAAGFLIEHKWQPKRALELLHQAQPLLAKEQVGDAANDNRSAQQQEDAESEAAYDRENFEGKMLRAARLAGQPEEAQALRASIEGPPPKANDRLSDYWLNRARLAALENRKADGLTYYQLALHTRVTLPAPRRGRLEDDLTDEARALWKEIGGTETAWAIWSEPPAAGPEILAQGRWEKPKLQLPAFELADLSGKTWKLAKLEGKSVLINLWATWCGPCNAELPHLQKLYDQMKDRPDFQILTFNVDEDLGAVEPFLKQKGYTFPVLPAYSFATGILDVNGIPQNWVVDPMGVWRWTQIGFLEGQNWADDMIKRLESVKRSE